MGMDKPVDLPKLMGSIRSLGCITRCNAPDPIVNPFSMVAGCIYLGAVYLNSVFIWVQCMFKRAKVAGGDSG